MAFPQDPLGIRAQMLINNTWTTITSRVRNDADIVITGGFAPEQTSLTPCNIACSINNRDGLFTDDNPSSIYYGLLPTNTALRVAVVETTPWLKMYNKVARDPITDSTTLLWDFVQTGDKATLDIVGDLDIRIEIEPEVWQLGNVGHHLAGKWSTSSNQRSYAWTILESGKMRLYWSSTGSNVLFADSTVAVTAGSRIALRATIDVDNGASGRTIVFYTSTSILGTWTQLGATVVQAGVTSIFSSTSNLQAGAIIDSTSVNAMFINPATDGTATSYALPLVGRLYRFMLYNGIAGTLVADMNATSRPEGQGGWNDTAGTPNLWGPQRFAEITLADFRGYGEISELPQEWDVSGKDVYIPTSANGIVRRLTQGAPTLQSAIYRNLRQYIGAGALGYWPLEGGNQTVAAGNAVPKGNAAQVNNVLFQTDTTLLGTAGTMKLNDVTSYIRATAKTNASATSAFLIWYMKVPVAPASYTETINLYTSGTIRRVAIGVTNTQYQINAYDSGGGSLGALAASFGTGGAPGQWLAFQVKLVTNGAGVDISLAWYALGTVSTFYGFTMNVASGTVGSPTGFYTSPGAGTMTASFAHVMFGNLSGWEYATAAFAQSSVGYNGERAAVRYMRVCREEGVRALVTGWPSDTEQMGPQPTATLMTVLDECVALDGGLHYESKDQPALIFRTGRSLYGQTANQLDYSLKHMSGSFRPTQDDRLLRNSVTIQRPSGSFATVTRDSGPKNTQPPPLGVGPYPGGTLTRNAYSDLRLPTLAGWEVGIGTWPDRRIPNLEVWLERSVFATNSTLTRNMRNVIPGSRVQVLSPPVWVGGQTQDALIRGYRETLQNRGHRLAFSTVPYGPYNAPIYDDPNTATLGRYDLRTSTLQSSMLSTDILMQTVSSSRRGFWSWKGVPYTIKVSGQLNTVLGATRPDSVSQQDTSYEGNTTTGWASTGGALTISTVTKPYGTYVLLQTVSGSPATSTVYDNIGAVAVVGGVYTVIAWVRCSVARNIGVYVDWLTSGAVYISTSGSETAVAANTWTEIQTTVIAPATTGQAKQGLYMATSPANGTLLYVKNLDLQRIDSRNARQVLLTTRGAPTKALSAAAEVHIYPQRGWAK